MSKSYHETKQKKIPETLYKYRSWKYRYHRRILTKNELFFAPASAMNDPYDFNIPPDYALLNTDERRAEYVNRAIRVIDPVIIQQAGGVDEFKRRNVELFRNDPISTQKYFEQGEYKRTNRYFGTLSLVSHWNNIQMWSYYAMEHRGFCVGFGTDELALAEIGALGPVNYGNFPHIDPLDENHLRVAILKSHSKAAGWQHEQEIRIAKVSFPEELSQAERKYIYPDRALKEIILGFRISDEHKSAIVKLAIQKNIPVFQTRLVSLEFSLNRYQLSQEEIDQAVRWSPPNRFRRAPR